MNLPPVFIKKEVFPGSKIGFLTKLLFIEPGHKSIKWITKIKINLYIL